MLSTAPASGLPDDPLWYKDAVIYELHVRAFRDSTGDGIGDFGGLREKLDYLADLGITAIWLLPFYCSPLRDGGYDISDYLNIHSDYGTKRDFRRFLNEAHARGIRVLTELVINHTSVDHEWFQRARKAPRGSSERNFYVWADEPTGFSDARIIFQDFENSNWAWDPTANAYYWHRFFVHQPDLNFDNPEVQDALLRVLDYWMGLGVDGVRLDAVPYLYEREGTTCENLPETHAFLKLLRAHVDAHYKNRMLLAEANQWPVDAAEYFGNGDECHMNFHFPLMPRLFMAIQTEDAFPIVDILRQTPCIPESCQWATFLRNHDELTLEMVTEEDRDYMYRVYAKDTRARLNLGIRHRLFPLLRDRRRVELMNGLLFALPGTPVIYYGDEIGMGDNIYLGDRDSMRTPMQWNSDRNAGFSSANPQRLYLPVIVDPEYHYETVNVEAQQTNPSSFLWWMKHLIALRKQHKALSRGSIQFIDHRNPRVIAFTRSYEGQTLLFVANLSRHAQCAELHLNQYRGFIPEEVFGRTCFPPIEDAPYRLSLGPYDQFWFLFKRREAVEAGLSATALQVHDSWWSAFEAGAREELAHRLVGFATAQRWFRKKGQRVTAATIDDVFRLDEQNPSALVVLGMDLNDGTRESYVMPLCYVSGDAARDLAGRGPSQLVTWLTVTQSGGPARDGAIFDGDATQWFADALLECVRRNRALPGELGKLEPQVLPKGQARLRERDLQPRTPGYEQSNSVIVYGNHLLTKLVRRVEAGPNIELEVAQVLARSPLKCRTAQVIAAVHYELGAESSTVAITSEYVENRGTAWDLMVDTVDVYFERVLGAGTAQLPSRPGTDTAKMWSEPLNAPIEHLAVPLFNYIRMIADRTAELHDALASPSCEGDFAPEPFSAQHQQSLYQSARSLFIRVADELRHHLAEFDVRTRELARDLLLHAESVDERLFAVTAHRFDALRIRCHGDYHLGQVLFTGDDFVIIDFEGEPARPLAERRFKRCPLRDVAGMTRSFDYAIATSLRSGRFRPDDVTSLSDWAAALRDWVTVAFVRAYADRLSTKRLIPHSRDALGQLLSFYETEKCLYEIAYELNNRPKWITIPMLGLARLIGIEAEHIDLERAIHRNEDQS